MISKERLGKILGEFKNRDVDYRHPWGYRCSYRDELCSVFEPPRHEKGIVAALDTCVIKKLNDFSFVIYPDAAIPLVKYKVILNTYNFPDLIEGSKLMSFLLLPYLREVKKDTYVKSQRLCVFTDKGQIYHNYPSRFKGDIEGYSQWGDISLFEESVVWDMPGRLFPADHENCESYEMYFPGLPDDCYQKHPISNSDKRFVDRYGNGGFGDYTIINHDGCIFKVPRFYIYSRKIDANPFHFIGTGEKNYKLNIIGTYRSNVDAGVRTCLFATSDGGRQWYCKYEFADSGEYTFQQGHSERWGRNFGNPINLKTGDLEILNGVKVVKRELIIPNESRPQPVEKYRWLNVGEVRDIRRNDLGLEIMTVNPTGLKTGNIIALSGDIGANCSHTSSWLLNNSYTPDSLGNNKLFKVEITSPISFRLYEVVSCPDNNIPCRHIHHINTLKDGWIIGTGEIYPNGWLLYLQNKKADTFTRCNASEDFLIIRLTSSEKSVQRTMGVLLKDDKCQTISFASDHDTLERTNMGSKINCSRGSTGVFVGSLNDLDDRNKFECIYESSEPCFYYQQLCDNIIFCGQRGDLAIADSALIWKSYRIRKPIIKYYGNYGKYYFFDSVIIKFN